MAFGQVLKARESKSSPTTETNLQNFSGKKLLPVFVRMKVSSNEEGAIFVPMPAAPSLLSKNCSVSQNSS